MKLVKTLVLGLLLTLSARSHAGWVIGYNGGYYPSFTNNLQAHAQSFNLLSEASVPMKVNPFFRGITTGIRINLMDDFGFIAGTFTTRKLETNWAKNSTSEEKWRVRSNYLTAEFGAGGEKLKGGASVDIGAVKFFSKRKDNQTNETTEWELVYDGGGLFNGGLLSAGFSFFVEYRLTGNFYSRAFAMLPIGMSSISDAKTDFTYGYNTTHFGLSLYVDLFRQD
ncbi:MAG: hypothetical protein EP332_11095 [Bacteroidetes bacterium]|nr:MAG: hypothetical protein EP332_11095 [Bacteroidota bacterium]